MRGLAISALLLAAVATVNTSQLAVPSYRSTYEQRTTARAKLAAGAEPEELQTLYPTPRALRRYIDNCRNSHLSVFRERR